MVESSANLGLVGSWRNAWAWRDRELFVILEDDAEVEKVHIHSPVLNINEVFCLLGVSTLVQVAG